MTSTEKSLDSSSLVIFSVRFSGSVPYSNPRSITSEAPRLNILPFKVTEVPPIFETDDVVTTGFISCSMCILSTAAGGWSE